MLGLSATVRIIKISTPAEKHFIDTETKLFPVSDNFAQQLNLSDFKPQIYLILSCQPDNRKRWIPWIPQPISFLRNSKAKAAAEEATACCKQRLLLKKSAAKRGGSGFIRTGRHFGIK